MERAILCVDNGLTTTKSVIFTLDGREVASAVSNTVVESKGAFAEIDMELQWKKTASVIKQSIVSSGIDPSSIIGVGNSGHGAGLYCLDGADKPVRRAVSSMDARTIQILQDWSKQGKSSYERLYQNLWSGQPIPILYWLKRNEPENYKRIEKILMVKDWIIFRLTGEVGIEYTDASNSGLVDPFSKEIDQGIFEMFDIGELYEKVPRLRKSTEIAGYVTKSASEETGLREGTPVMGGVFDVVACALGSGVCEDDKFSLIAGTWNVNSGVEKRLIRTGETVKLSLFADIESYIYVESSATSAVNLEWFIDNLIKGYGLNELPTKRVYDRIEEEVGKIRPEDASIIYFPFLYKSHLAKNLDGCFFGIKPEYGIFNLVRAVMEGVVFAHLKHLLNLKQGGIVRDKAVLSGGASNSGLWCQMFADILNMQVATTGTSQVGALGTAVCTSVGAGEYRDLNEAVKAMVREKNIYYPDRKINNIYMERYAQFTGIIGKFDED